MNQPFYLDNVSKQLFDELPVMIAWYDLDMRLVWANKVLVDALGKPLDDLVEKSCRQIWRLAQVDISDYPIAIAKQNKQIVERQINLADGRIWSMCASPVYNQTGELMALSEVIRIIATPEKEKINLEQKEWQYKVFIEAVNNLAIAVDREYRICFIMGRRLNDYLIKVGDLISDTIKILYPCPEGENIQDYCRQVFETNEAFSIECIYEYNNKTKSDKIFLFPIDQNDGEFNHVGILFRDITARKTAEIALKESEKNLQDIIEFLPDATLVIDKQGKVIAWNRAIEKMTGVAKEKMLGEGDYLYAVPFYNERRPILADLIFDEKSPLIDNYSNLKRFGETFVAEVHLPVLNQENDVDLWVIAAPLYNNDGELMGSIESIRDISEHKKAENQLKTTLAEKEALLRELYHRTKNNMQMISSMLSLQSDFVTDPQVLSVFKDMENRIRSMALVHQRLYQSRNLSSIDLAEYANELIGLLLQSYNAHPDLVQIKLNAEPITVLIDTAIPCGLIINELVSNSLKYAFPDKREGEIEISLSKPSESDILLTVMDNGIGVAPDFDPRIMGKLGMQIVFALGEQQLGGKVSFEMEQGFICNVQFPLPSINPE